MNKESITRYPLTDSAFVATEGVSCPNCGSHQIEGMQFTVEGSIASQPMVCKDCTAEWTNIYQLSGYRGMDTPF